MTKKVTGKLRLNHCSYTPDGGTWLSSPSGGRQAHYNMEHNFEKRCDTALLIRRKVMTLYTEYDKKKAKRRANWLRKQQLLKEQQKTEKIESNEKN